MPPSPDQEEDLLLACRYGDIDDVRIFVETYGALALEGIRDEHQNTVLHMLCANGHDDLLEYLLPLINPTLISAQNSSKSTPLHWAALNCHLPIIKRLVQFPGGPQLDLIDIKNEAGRTPIGEAELAGWDEGASWLVSVMKLDSATTTAATAGDDNVGADDERIDAEVVDIEVEVEDAEGQISRMSMKTDGMGDSKLSELPSTVSAVPSSIA
ncbi:hypothetical protein BS47DRAFT_1371997 [Hydnum rufescens UP504]|uniref:Ankyrin n=1 Tax=Hydnum rufescens UP504 TaxID=1448309 RepID=A0A9P6DY17_9AGAM|nr:hypothetical protein BS47DRAFT_1371997 [Hydnum rufescens UP504]